jgi:hypothetical protein
VPEYFVPKSDPDCDCIPVEKECNPYWFQYQPVGSCISRALAIPNACAIGRSACADGVSSDTTCGADTQRAFTCLPDAFCNYCSAEIPADTCIAKAVIDGLATNTLSRYECAFDAQSTGAPCTDERAVMQLPWVNAMCGTPVLHTIDKPFTEPQSSLTFGVAPNEVRFTPKLIAGECNVELAWTGGTTETFKEGITFLLEVPYDNATRAIYPIRVSPSNQAIACSAPLPSMICAPIGPTSDNVGLCAERL